MRKDVFFVLLILCLYFFRLSIYPNSDIAILNLIPEGKSEIAGIYKLQIVDEPSIKNNFLTAKVLLIGICDTDNLISCTEFEADSFTELGVYSQAIKNLVINSGNSKLQISDSLYVKGTLKHVVDNRFRKDNIFSTLKVTKVLDIEDSNSVKLRSKLVDLRILIESTIQKYIEGSEGGLAQGLVISGKGSMPDELLEHFKRVGLIHIVVLSGSNVSIISGALMALLSCFNFSLRAIIGITCMTSFALMTGAMPPVVRSVIMSSIPLVVGIKDHLLGIKIYKKNLSENFSDNSKRRISFFGENNLSVSLLFIAGSIMAIHSPLIILYDISFQLSFMATLGLMTLTEPISNAMTFITERFMLREIIASSLATQVYVVPILLTISDQLSSVFLIANIVVLPILPIIMLLIGVTTFTGFIIPALAQVFGSVSWIILNKIIQFVVHLSEKEYAVFTVGLIDPKTALIIYLIIIPISFQLRNMARNVTISEVGYSKMKHMN